MIRSTMAVLLSAGLLCGHTLGQSDVRRPTESPLLSASDDIAAIEFWAAPPAELDLLGRFEAVLEVRADASVRVDRWNVRDALGTALLVTVLEASEVQRVSRLDGEPGEWFGRYALLVEPLVDGEVVLGPIRLEYLVDPDPRSDPTQIAPTRVVVETDRISLPVRGPGGELPAYGAAAKGAVEADRPFNWRVVLVSGLVVGVAGPAVAALALASRTATRRRREDAPAECMQVIESLERVASSADDHAISVNGANLAAETVTAIRAMLEIVYRLPASTMTGPELVSSGELRGVLSADAFEQLRHLVEATEQARFAGATLDRQQSLELLASAKAVVQAVEAQRRAMS